MAKIIARGFGILMNYATNIFMTIGWIIGIAIVTPETAGLYGVSVVFLIQVCDRLQWSLKQIITLETFMVSTERSFSVLEMPS